MRKRLTKTYHTIFDAFDIDQLLLSDEHFMFGMLMEMPGLVGMKILSGPNLVRDYDTGHEGLTGFVIIDFSHISIHTFRDTQEIFIDIFSCKPFDQDAIREYLYEKLGAARSKVETMDIKYPGER